MIRNAKQSSTSSYGSHDQLLKVSDVPALLTWRDPWRMGERPLKHHVPVDFGYIYNPSVLELEDGTRLFAARMSWVYGGECAPFALSEDGDSNTNEKKALYNCLKIHGDKFADQTLLGQYHPQNGELQVLSPKAQGDLAAELLGSLPSKSTEEAPREAINANPQEFGVEKFSDGVAWFDVRLQYPYSHRYNGTQSKNKIIITGQTAEVLRNADWNELYDESGLGLQLMHIGALDPSEWKMSRTDKDGSETPNVNNGTSPVFRHHNMTRWYFHDPEKYQDELKKRQRGRVWTPMVADVAQVKCHKRPPHLVALPFEEKETRDIPVQREKEQNQQAQVISFTEEPEESNPDLMEEDHSSHRRLAALTGDDWFTIKDKNWSPFVYQDRLLWSYTIEPHIVCENDVGMDDLDEVDCVLCIRQYETSSTKLWDQFNSRIQRSGFDKVETHLNGAPSYYVERIDAYLGILHIIKTRLSRDIMGIPQKERFYEHYFYKTQAEPPFRVTEIASSRVPLERSLCASPWFDTDETVHVEFVMYMQYHPDRPGQEIVLSYGEADHKSHIRTMSLDEVLLTFDTTNAFVDNAYSPMTASKRRDKNVL